MKRFKKSVGLKKTVPKIGKKILSVLLALAMGISLLPATALADTATLNEEVPSLGTPGTWIDANRRAPLVWSTIQYTGNARNYSNILNSLNMLAEKFPMYEYAVLDGWLAQHYDGSTAPYGCYEYDENGYLLAAYQQWYDEGITYETFANDCLERGIIPGVYYNPMWVYKRTVDDVGMPIDENTPGASNGINPTIVGTDIPLKDIINTGSSPVGTSEGRNGNDLAEFQSWWYVDPSKEGAKEYIQGMIYYFKDMGYGYMKIDFIRQAHYFYGQEAMEQVYEWLREAAGDDFILSFANARQVDYMSAEAEYSDMNRISPDTSGWSRVSQDNRGRIQRSEWDTVRNLFDGYNYFSDLIEVGPSAGEMILDGDHTRGNQLTSIEMESVIALKVLGGGGIQMSDTASNSIGESGAKPWAFVNEEFLDLVYEGFYAKPLQTYTKQDTSVRGTYRVDSQTYEPKTQIWAGQDQNGDIIVGLFNREDTDEVRSINIKEDLGGFDYLKDFDGEGRYDAIDLWQSGDLRNNTTGGIETVVGEAITEWSEVIPAHGCRILRLRAVDYVEISDEEIELTINGGIDSYQLSANIVLEESGGDESVTWTSSDDTVATVDANGLVNAVGTGIAAITATSAEKPEVSAQCKVTVYDFSGTLTAILLPQQDEELNIGDTWKVTPVLTPEYVWNKDVTWSTDSPNIASVDQDGVVTAVGLGSAVITCSSVANPGVFAECSVTVTPSSLDYGELIAVSLNKNVVSMLPGNSMQLDATVLNAEEGSGVTWSSLDENVATVTTEGVVTITGKGTTTIIARSNSNPDFKAHCIVYGATEGTVYEAEATKGAGLNGTAIRTGRANYSGGSGVGNIGNSATTRFLLMDVEASEAGLYNLGLYYGQNKEDSQDTGLVTGGASRSVYVSANGGISKFMVLQGTIAANFNTPEQEPASTTIELSQGTNELKWFNNSAWASDVDKVTVTKAFSLVGVAGNVLQISNSGKNIKLTETVVSGTMNDLEDYATALSYRLYNDGILIEEDEVEGQTGIAPTQSCGSSTQMNGFLFKRDYEHEVDVDAYTQSGDYTIVFTAEKDGTTVVSEPLYLFSIPAEPLYYDCASLARAYSSASAVNTAANDRGSTYVQFATAGSIKEGDWIEFTIPDVPEGIYEISLRFKGRAGRGTVMQVVDGQEMGLIDQTTLVDGVTDSYPYVSAGIIELDAGTHLFRYVVTKTGSLNFDRIELKPLKALPEVNSYTVSYELNEGSGIPPAAVTYKDKEVVTVEDAADIYRVGYIFDSWNTQADAGGLSFAHGETFAIESDITLYAIWKQDESKLITILTEGNGTVSVNDKEGSTEYSDRHEMGETITVSAIGDNFSHWENSNNRIISTERSLEFEVVIDTEYTAVFAINRTVTFVNKNDQVISSIVVGEDSTEIDYPQTPFSYGYIFSHWNMTTSEILNALKDGNVTVRAEYTKSTEKYQVNITDGKTSGLYEELELVTVTPNEAQSGKKFSYWAMLDGTIMSYQSNYSFYLTNPVDLQAVFVNEEAEVKKSVLLQITNVVSNTAAGKLSFTAERSLPSDTTIVQHGILLTQEDLDEGSFRIGAAGVLKGTATTTGRNGTYALNKGNANSGDTWYGRAYVVYKEADGTVKTVYSDIVRGTMD